MMASSSSKNGMKKNANSKKDQTLVDVVFSWSLGDVLNCDLYRGKVDRIPKKFLSTADYMHAFINPLVEETHADLLSKMTTLSRAPTCEISYVEISKGFKPPKELHYNISLKRLQESDNSEKMYEPMVGDLIALTDVRPVTAADLNRPNWCYNIALVQRFQNESTDSLRILSSKPIMFEKRNKGKGKKTQVIFAVHLTNLTTNTRIWNALKSSGGNMNIIKRVLQIDYTVRVTIQFAFPCFVGSIFSPISGFIQAGENCTLCYTEGIRTDAILNLRELVRSFKLDDSQEAAVLSCIATRECHHKSDVKLLWGPPGTGKTKTVASLLFVLSKIKCRTLTCAPTNVAVVEVTERLVSLVRDSLKYDTYGLGDIVIFGNGERLKIDDHEDLLDIFLDNRIDCLSECFAPRSGWASNLESMICLLENPKQQYHRYFKEEENVDENKVSDSEESVQEARTSGYGSANNNSNNVDEINHQYFVDAQENKIWRKVIAQTAKDNESKEAEKKKATPRKRDDDGDNVVQHEKVAGKAKKEHNNFLKFEEFVMNRFSFIGNELMSCIKDLYTHMPTSLISVEVVKKMMEALELLQSIKTLISDGSVVNEGFREVLSGIQDARQRMRSFIELRSLRMECLHLLKSLRDEFTVPNSISKEKIRSFCLKNATLVFCTVSSSCQLDTKDMTPLELLVIDEAAQLKECESAITLQLKGLRHAILIGDEKQLPAMVQSKICENLGFGRSLFERLVQLGHAKHLLQIQYRMHPSISLFPNKKFYDGQILDGPNVKDEAYNRRFIEGEMFGAYSFINVSDGNEELGNSHSFKNMAEVAAVAEIVASLFKESVARKQRVGVGCISPYNAQVYAIQEKLSEYSTDADSEFYVNVRSVDGFQGGEEDVIIISTVRSNGQGIIGFLSNRRRASVALTRARYCLWILGNEKTLVKRRSIWKKLVEDAKVRGCFYNYNVNKGKSIGQAPTGALLDLEQLNDLLKMGSLVLKEARWKVCCDDDFLKSMAKIKNVKTRLQVISFLKRLSSGWRPNNEDQVSSDTTGLSSLLLKQYGIHRKRRLIWSVDVHEENSEYIQVLKLWDVVRKVKIPELMKRVDIYFEKYTDDIINICTITCVEGNLVVPVTLPMHSNTVSEATIPISDLNQSLTSQLAALSLSNEPGTSASSRNHKQKPPKKDEAKTPGNKKERRKKIDK